MDKDPIEKVLKSFGLTEKETEVYIFLAKHGALQGRKIARQMKIDKGQLYSARIDLCSDFNPQS